MEIEGYERPSRASGLVLGAALLLAVFLSGGLASANDGLGYELRNQLEQPLKKKVGELAQAKNAKGYGNKRGAYSKLFKKIDDNTYQVTFHVDTAEDDALTTERLLLTLKRKGTDTWEIAEEKAQQSYTGLYPLKLSGCRPFESFNFDREGLKLSANHGGVCIYDYAGHPAHFVVMADDLAYSYTAPKYLDYYQLHGMMMDDYKADLVFTPELFDFRCNQSKCAEILQTSFKGLELPTAGSSSAPAKSTGGSGSKLDAYVEKNKREYEKQAKDYLFATYYQPVESDRNYYRATVQRDEKHKIGITYDDWGSYDVTFWVDQELTQPSGLNDVIFGYYTAETSAETDPYDLERRDDPEARFFDLHSLKGEVSAALEDPEMLEGDIRYGVTIKRDTDKLPVLIATIPTGEGEDSTKPSLFVNSVEYKGQELTWVKTSPFTGLIIFPETLKAGSKIDLRMIFQSKAIRKVNHAFSSMFRGGWLPLVRFGDMIDEFELEVRAPAQYTILGIGKKIEERKEGDVLITRWKADNPVDFPTIIFGKYESDSPKIEAKRKDGSLVPVRVFVDEVSMMQLNFDVQTQQKANEFDDAARSGARGIRGKQLRPIGDQAVNAINLYTELTGLDYPYGELNLVNDPAPALYGQAPSSLIYLGSLVFRGEGTMAGDTIMGGGGTSTAKFLKSVVAHEVGHQWWGSRIANANSKNYWFVESLAEFMSAIWLENVHGRKEYMEQVDEWRKRVLEVDQRVSVQNASVQWGGEFPGAAYQAAVYNKGPYAFHILRETFGDEKFFPAFRQFTQDLAEKREVVTRDLQVALEKAFGGIDADGKAYNVDLSWFFDQWIRSSGIPQYALNYRYRQAEDKTWVVEGDIKQRVVVGNASKYKVLEDKYYRGMVSLTVTGKDKKDYPVRFPINGALTPFKFKVPVEPREIVLNKNGEMLALDVLVNRDF